MGDSLRFILMGVKNNLKDLIEGELASSGRHVVFRFVQTPSKLFSLMNKFRPDAVFTDDSSFLDKNNNINDRFNRLTVHTRVIICPSRFSHVKARKFINAGAFDFINQRETSSISVSIARLLKTIVSKNIIDEQKLLYDYLVEDSGEALFIIDEKGIIKQHNSRASQLLGIPLDSDNKVNIKETCLFGSHDISDISFDQLDKIETLRFEQALKKPGGYSVMVEIKIKTIGTKRYLFIIRDINDWKKPLNSLIESEQRFRLVFENAAIGQTITDFDGKFLKVNKAFCNLLGYTEKELYDLDIPSVTFPPDMPISWEIVGDLKEGNGDVKHFKKRYIAKSGHIITGDVSVIIQRDSKGQPAYLISQIQDITERENALEKLKKLSRAINQSPVSVVITDRDGYIDYVNPMFSQVTGYSLEELLGKKTSIIKSDQTPRKTYSELWMTISGGKTWRGELLNKRKNGELYWDEVVISPLKNSDGLIINYIGVQVDITGKKKAEESILKSENEFRSVWENSADGMRLCSADGKIIRVNEAFCRLFSGKKEDFEGKQFDIFYKYGEKTLKKFKEHFIKKKIRSKFETKVDMKNGKTIWLDISNSFIIHKNEPMLLLSIFRDITAKKKVEKELLEAKEKAEEMNRLKSNFIANMSHELRTPMIGILGFSEILRSTVEEGQIREMVDTIFSSGQRLMETLNLILDLSKIEADKLDINLKEQNASMLIKETVEIYQPNAEKKGVSLTYNGPDKIHLVTDERLFRGIVNNLVNNAVKYTHKGKVEIIAEEKKLNEAQSLFIKIKDTGIGIPPEKISLIFEAFRQVSEGYSRLFEGTGLGLTITKKFVEVLKGDITVESEEGSGTTFSIMLPGQLNSDNEPHNTPIIYANKRNN